MRAVLAGMVDGEKHWATELYAQVGFQRPHGAVRALNWLARHDFVTAADPVLIAVGVNRTDHVWVITGKGRAAAADLDAGYPAEGHRRPR
ncbi:hypothetical protein [Nocardia nova]|uniref:hypothetical protein n=1 Tax=Nocardia nova TaxID=37330 RepID=UPI0011DDB287|nr:hypothetical protein [Nocardia nova]